LAAPVEEDMADDTPTITLGLNHLVLWVRDARVSAAFYEQALGLVGVNEMPGAVFMRAPGSGNDHDLGLFTTPSPAPDTPRAVGMYHMAWEVPTLDVLAERATALRDLGALVGASDHGATKSLYAHDPDGIEFEVMWQVPVHLQTGADGLKTTELDLAAEIERFGGQTQSGTRTPAPT
jgi:catechol-2,3-dioxygenase